MNHTKTPWYKSGDSQLYSKITQKTVAMVINHDDLAFIVRACNAHDELLEAAKEYLEINPAFNSAKIGSPNSIARSIQDKQIKCEEALKQAIQKASSHD